MALKLNLVLAQETINDAYVNIHHGRTLADNTFIAVNYWRTQEDRFSSSAPIVPGSTVNIPKPVLHVEYVAPTRELLGDFWPAMYNYLKTLPEFAGALDC